MSLVRFAHNWNIGITWGGYRIYADYLEFNRKTRRIAAKGRVTMNLNQQGIWKMPGYFSTYMFYILPVPPQMVFVTGAVLKQT